MHNKGITTLVLAMFLSGITMAKCSIEHPQTDVYENWKLGVQAWSFNRFTLFEAIDKTRALGLDWIQVYPGQPVSKDMDAKFGHSLSARQRQQIKDKLHDANVGIVAFGVVGIPADESGARALFEFAKEMDIAVLVAEPKADQFDLIDALCVEYQIKLAIHNHPEPSHYWSPDTVLRTCEGRSRWIGACADVGHWVRSGLDPVECLKQLEGRIHDIHIKEIDQGEDVVWGTGQGRIKGILKELHRQGYQGTFSIEYEGEQKDKMPDIRESIKHFNTVASILKPTGWKDLFDPKLSNATFREKGWAVEGGEMVCNNSGDIWTVGEYSDFVLDFEFKLDKKTNSGVFLRVGEHTTLPWIEIQVEDSHGRAIDKHICGAIFDVKEPMVNAVKPAGEWNRMTILANDSKICVMMNNQPIQEIDLNDWPEAHKNPDGTNNKFDIAYKDLPRKGWVGFQDHGTLVWYRNIKIREL